MAGQTKITVDEKNVFPPWVQKIVKRYRGDIKGGIAEAIDRIRLRAATKYIVPSTTGSPTSKGWSPYKAAKAQPSHPTKLTSRTGKLVAMLKHKASPNGKHWTGNLTNKVSRLRTNAFRGLIKVAGGFKTPNETYVGTLRLDIQEGGLTNDLVAVKHLHGRVATPKALLAIRFRHETGIRGTRRPFIGLALRDETLSFRKVMRQKMEEIGRIK